MRRLLREYWNKSTMVARAGGYYGTGFKGERGVTQGDPLSPTIFNMVVDAVVRHWVTLAVKEAETRGERGKEGRHQASLFYADDGMVSSSDPRWLQWVFTTLVGLFDRVGLNKNTGKTVSMTCRPCTVAGNQSEEAYGRKMTGEGLRFRERKIERVECRDCGNEVAAGSLDSHRMTQNGKAREIQWTWIDAATGGGGGGEPQTYRIEFPKGGMKECPVEGCPGRAGTRTAMRVHLWRRHVRDVLIILEEGNLPQPRFPRFNMLVPWQSINGRHKSTSMCRSGAEKKRRRLAEAEVRDSAEMDFEVYGEQLQAVPSFKYLGRILTEGGRRMV